ncbi:MAG: hypothetical protein D6820_05980, partial [Lentisphaerae bacterium]
MVNSSFQQQNQPRGHAKTQWKDWGYATAIALALFLIPGFLFRIPQHRITTQNNPATLITSVPITSEQTTNQTVIQRIQQWVVMEDSALLLLPPELGPNRDFPIRNWVDRDNEYTPLMIPFTYTLITLIGHSFILNSSPPNLLIPIRSSQEIVSLFLPQTPFPIPATSEHTISRKTIPWSDANGNIIKEIPPIPIASIPESLRWVQRPTCILIKKITSPADASLPQYNLANTDFVQATIQTSSGNRDLDLLAIRYLTKTLLRKNKQPVTSWLENGKLLWIIWPVGEK